MKRLFIVEYSSSVGMGLFSFGSPSLFVVAESYDQAALKAVAYLEEKNGKRGVVDINGDLRMPEDIKVTGVRLAAEEVVW